jgi:arylsulfatase A-like enzyme
MLTGRHPHGIESMSMEGKYPGSTYDPKQCPFFPAQMRQQGYHTAHIGKWHTGTDSGWGRDWDHQIVWNRPLHQDNAGAYYQTQITSIDGKEQTIEGYPADNYTQWSLDYIRGKNRDAAKPWYLWLCYGSVHGPSTPAKRHKGSYKSAEVPVPADIFPPREGKPDYLNNTQAWAKGEDGQPVAGKNAKAKKAQRFDDWVRQVNECVPAIDEGVGQLIAALKETGQYDNTLVIYTADQGFAMGEHGFRTKLAPYDANYRSPFIVSMPSRFPTGQFCDVSVNGPDLVATFLALTGVKVPWPFTVAISPRFSKSPAPPGRTPATTKTWAMNTAPKSRKPSSPVPSRTAITACRSTPPSCRTSSSSSTTSTASPAKSSTTSKTILKN